MVGLGGVIAVVEHNCVTRGRFAFLFLLACAVICLAPDVRAQPVRTRILDHLEIRESLDSWEVTIAFSNAIRYLRHSPAERGRDLHIQLENIAVSRIDRIPSLQRESLNAPADTSAPIEEVVYDGDPEVGPSLGVRFTRSVEFDVRQGEDFRSLVVVIRKDGTGRSGRPDTSPAQEARPERNDVVVDLRDPYAIQLHVALEGEPLPEIPDLEIIRRSRLYATTFLRDGEIWRRLRLGFFPTRSEARAARAELEPYFPDAWIATVGPGEHVASAAALVTKPLSRAEEVPSPSGLPAETRTEIEAWIERGRDAMTAGDVALAIRILTKVLSYPEHAYSREARELLGLARERNGQLAHAKAEYEEYLVLYPEGEGSDRVRQRLAAMLTAAKAAPEPLRTAESRASEWDFSGFGSLGASYRRGELLGSPDGGRIEDSSTLVDINFTGRARRRGFDIEMRAAGQHRYDLVESGRLDEGLRMSTLFAASSIREYGLAGTLGRQSANSGGVLGRFDGLKLSYARPSGWQYGLVGGFPVDFSRSLRVDTGHYFAGASVDTPRLFDSFRGELWAIGQMAGGIMDRAAVGAELRYAEEGRNVVGFVDYDVYFGSLNTALLLGNWPLRDDTDLNFTLDYRNSPVLTKSNALLGQTAETLGDLRFDVPRDQHNLVARDRTPRSKTATLGMTHRLTPRYQISGDVTVTELDGTPASAGLTAIEGTGIQFLYNAQLIGTTLLTEGDAGILGLRVIDARDFETYGVSLSSRVPIGRTLRINPRVTVDYRLNHLAADFISVRPNLRVDWRLWKFTLSADAGFEWRDRFGGPLASEEYGYFAEVGIRFDYY